MLAPAHQLQSVRCRQIAESDLDAAADPLTRGFLRSHRAFWTGGSERRKTLSPIEAMPRFGYVLEGEQGLAVAPALNDLAYTEKVILG